MFFRASLRHEKEKAESCKNEHQTPLYFYSFMLTMSLWKKMFLWENKKKHLFTNKSVVAQVYWVLLRDSVYVRFLNMCCELWVGGERHTFFMNSGNYVTWQQCNLFHRAIIWGTTFCPINPLDLKILSRIWMCILAEVTFANIWILIWKLDIPMMDWHPIQDVFPPHTQCSQDTRW